MKQKAEITLEVEETIVFNQGEQLLSEFCPRCDATTILASAALIALATGSSERQIFRLAEAGAIHFIERERFYACTSCLRRPIMNRT